ncbi:unnamed protein product [Darwinula stevensoni]|uniref:Uncharacterized protein n=1 Tax=Darwinula stevensoni TaxID=69355 RepID=A0A7R8X4D1_9CRUS|nr:unnamed protein product [Darwinula stevensoni]CAG0885479.1 unnamed protein product [Darwinula stevensoni]
MTIHKGGFQARPKGDMTLTMEDFFRGKHEDKYDLVEMVVSLKQDIMQLRGQVEHLQQSMGTASSIAPAGMEKVDPGVNRNVSKPRNEPDTFSGQGAAKDLIEYFKSNPTAQSIRVELRNSAEFPEITVCPVNAVNSTADQIRIRRLNLSSDSAFKWDKEDVFDVSYWEDLDFLTLKNLYNILDYCYVGSERCMPDFTIGDWTWINDSLILETSEAWNIRPSGQTFFVTKENSYIVNLSVKDYSLLPSGSKCNADRNYDYQKCLDAALGDKLSKDAPCFIPSLLPRKREQPDMERQCNTSDEVNNLGAYYADLQRSFQPECQMKCKRMAYNVIPMQVSTSTQGSIPGLVQFIIPSAEEVPFTETWNIRPSGQTFFVTKENSYIVNLSVKDYSLLPSGSKCNADRNYDYQKCLDAALGDKLSKEAPCFIPSLLPRKREQPNMERQCNTSDEVNNLGAYYADLQRSFQPECQMKCKRMAYNVIPMQVSTSTQGSIPGLVQFIIPSAERPDRLLTPTTSIPIKSLGVLLSIVRQPRPPASLI